MIGRIPVSLQINAVVVAVSLLVVGAAYLSQLWSLERALLANERRKLENVSFIVKSLIASERLRLSSLAVALKGHRELAVAQGAAARGDPAAVRTVMDRLYRETGVALLYLINRDGVVTYRAHLPEQHGDRSTIWGVAEALEGEDMIVASKGPLGLGIRALAPLRDGERIVGVVMVGTVFDEVFAKRLSAVTSAAIAFASLDGIWSSSAPGRHADFGAHKPFVAQSLYERTAVFALDREAGLARQYTPTRIEGETFLLLVESDVAPALAQLQASQMQLLTSAGLALVCAIVLGSLITFLLVRPLRELRKRALKLVKDLAGEHIVSPGGNEVSSLVRAFDLATDALSRNAGELRVARDAAEAAARHDALTGLPNRMLLQQLLTQVLMLAKRGGSHAAVLYLDLDNFKTVNDTLGHEAGDQLLKRVAAKLRETVREADIVCRLGGDEFLVVLTSIRAPENAAPVAAKVLDSLAQAMVLGGSAEFRVSASIGISVFPLDGESGDQLIRRADAAMYYAKEGGRNNFCYYTADMDQQAHQSLRLDGELRKALERQEFRLHYQPQFDLRSGALIGAEALIRWLHPQRGLLPPAEFIGVAEQRGLIVPIGEWVIEAACRQVQAWIGAGHAEIPVAVNLSALQFRQDDLEAKIRRILGHTGLEPRLLELEITESSVLLGAEAVRARLQALRSIGLSLAIDDFGTGYSALGYLKRFPINRLKLDRVFVRDVLRDPDDAAIARAIVAMAIQLRLQVIAEGVETAEQARFLADNGCHGAQGYYFGRPCSAEEFSGTFLAGGSKIEAVAHGIGL